MVTILRSNAAAAQWPRLRAPRPRGPLGVEFDPFDRRVIADPPAAYRRLHERGGVHRCRRRRMYVLSDYEHVREAARASDILTSARGVTRVPAALPMMLTMGRPRHGELRKLVAPYFTADSASAFGNRMRTVTAEAIDRMLAAPDSDAVASLAIPLPITVIADCLGIPDSDVAVLKRFSDGVIEGFHADRSPAMLWRSARILQNVNAFYRYMRGVFDRLRRDPGADVISALIASQEGGVLSDEDLFWFALMLTVAGNETTTNLIGSMLLAFATDAEAYERLRAEPALIEPAIEEALRWGSPIQGMFRTANSDYEIGTTTIPAGARVMLSFGAANRDPHKYAEPDRFVIDRRPRDHVAFGLGMHFCLGAHLARLEAAVVLRELTRRAARIDLAGPVGWTRNPTVRGPVSLPLKLVAA
jgi:cytochrome P450